MSSWKGFSVFVFSVAMVIDLCAISTLSVKGEAALAVLGPGGVALFPR